MRAVKLLSLLILLIMPTLTVVACKSGNEFLEINNEEIYDDNIEPIKLNQIAKMFIFTPPSKSKKCSKDKYLLWTWNLNNKKVIIGTMTCGNLELGSENWTLTIKKTKNNGIYVSDWNVISKEPHIVK